MSVSITLRNARALIETAIVDNLQYAYGIRLPPAADPAALRALPSTGLADRSAMRFVTSAGFAFQWRRYETAADDGVNYIQPSDAPGPGRWCLASPTGTTSTAQTGYVQRVDLYNDDGDDLEIFEQRIFGKTPAMLLSFDRTEREPKSLQFGGLYYCRAHFTLFVVSVNPRGGQAARQGSPLSAEALVQPGTEAMIGDAMLVLAGASLGINDVAFVQIHNDGPVVQDLARGRFVESLELEVLYTETQPDASIVPINNYGFNVNYQAAELNTSGVMDTANDVTSNGLQFALGNSLTQSFTGGTLKFNGAPLTLAGASHTFSANAVTYRDVDANGVLYYTVTAVGDPPPSVGYGRIRLGVTATDTSGVRLDRLLASALIPFGPTDKIANPALVSIAISPTSISVPTGTPVQFTATGTYDDASTVDITYLVTWKSDNGNTTFTPAGVANTSAPGTAHITATLTGVTSNTATLTAT